MSLRGIRGAISVEENTEENILENTEQLLKEMLSANNVNNDDIATIFFSVTSELDAVFPAKAARNMGLINTPLLCLSEIPVQGSIEKCVRLLIQVNSIKEQKDMEHIYLKEAIALRPDMTKK